MGDRGAGNGKEAGMTPGAGDSPADAHRWNELGLYDPAAEEAMARLELPRLLRDQEATDEDRVAGAQDGFLPAAPMRRMLHGQAGRLTLKKSEEGAPVFPRISSRGSGRQSGSPLLSLSRCHVIALCFIPPT